MTCNALLLVRYSIKGERPFLPAWLNLLLDPMLLSSLVWRLFGSLRDIRLRDTWSDSGHDGLVELARSSHLYPTIADDGIDLQSVPSRLENRMEEYMMFADLMPRTSCLSYSLDCRAMLDRQFPGGWIARADGSCDSLSDELVTSCSPRTEANADRLLECSIVSELRDMSIPRWKAALSGLLPIGYPSMQRGTSEWRVHVVTGPGGAHIVPRLTQARGNSWDRFVEWLVPFGLRTPSQARAERIAGKAVARIGRLMGSRPSVWGLDIGLPGLEHDGYDPGFVIETNPSVAEGAFRGMHYESGITGWIENPASMSRIVASMHGRTAPIDRLEDFLTLVRVLAAGTLLAAVLRAIL